MKRTKYKWFWAWEFEEEEKWLNGMVQNGLHLTGVGLCKFIFEEGEPGDYVIRLEMLEKSPGSGPSRDYISFIEDTGAEHIGNVMRWAYFRKKAADGPFDLFSGLDGRIRHLERLLKLLGAVGLFEIGAAMQNISVYHRSGHEANNAGGILCVLCALLVAYGFSIVWKKREALKREREIHE